MFFLGGATISRTDDRYDSCDNILLSADDLKRFHSDPDVWWIGQIVKHVTRVRPWLMKKLKNFKKASKFASPIVG